MRDYAFMVPWIILLLILLALAAPAGIKKKSWLRLIVGMVLSFLIVVLPLFFFFCSTFMAPDWKGACPHGWLNCFIVGKVVLTPLVLVATAALYLAEVVRVDVARQRWAVVAIFIGAIVAWGCCLFGFICLDHERGTIILMLVPLYIAVWHTVRAVLLIRAAGFSFWTYGVAALGTIPFWLVSWIISVGIYATLPDKPPDDCFVVTAAGRGHRKFVGPFFEIERRGERRRANRQLITLWEFENLWRSKSPRSHHYFRRLYNQAGPRIAARIRSPWLADLAFLALKPAEVTARFINNHAKL
jgi:hypothetical protein